MYFFKDIMTQGGKGCYHGGRYCSCTPQLADASYDIFTAKAPANPLIPETETGMKDAAADIPLSIPIGRAGTFAPLLSVNNSPLYHLCKKSQLSNIVNKTNLKLQVYYYINDITELTGNSPFPVPFDVTKDSVKITLEDHPEDQSYKFIKISGLTPEWKENTPERVLDDYKVRYPNGPEFTIPIMVAEDDAKITISQQTNPVPTIMSLHSSDIAVYCDGKLLPWYSYNITFDNNKVEVETGYAGLTTTQTVETDNILSNLKSIRFENFTPLIYDEDGKEFTEFESKYTGCACKIPSIKIFANDPEVEPPHCLCPLNYTLSVSKDNAKNTIIVDGITYVKATIKVKTGSNNEISKDWYLPFYKPPEKGGKKKQEQQEDEQSKKASNPQIWNAPKAATKQTM